MLGFFLLLPLRNMCLLAIAKIIDNDENEKRPFFLKININFLVN